MIFRNTYYIGPLNSHLHAPRSSYHIDPLKQKLLASSGQKALSRLLTPILRSSLSKLNSLSVSNSTALRSMSLTTQAILWHLTFYALRPTCDKSHLNLFQGTGCHQTPPDILQPSNINKEAEAAIPTTAGMISSMTNQSMRKMDEV